MRATRDEGLARARADQLSRSLKASDGGSWMRHLLLVCVVLLCGGCATNATSTGNTPATTPDGVARPTPSQSASDGRVNVQPSPAPSGTEEVARGTTQSGPGDSHAPQTPSTVSDKESAEASKAYGGFYEVQGAHPEGFEQFANFVIRSPEHGRISGAVIPTEGKVYEFARATLAGQRLTFVTHKVGSISYSFDGTFLAAPPFAGDKNVAVVEGTVKKFRNDQSAAEASLKFYFDEGGEEP
ncbi:MAG TPA: hypothetical protein VGO91_13590 [Pyrinomonadaceae bacterium]|jgi:hypothetical protein|nr:hypothetical protein [Pyrinomonadaceae bacterium]